MQYEWKKSTDHQKDESRRKDNPESIKYVEQQSRKSEYSDLEKMNRRNQVVQARVISTTRVAGIKKCK
jgi:hypothetical protein